MKKADCIFALTDNWTRFYTDELRLENVVTINNIVSNPQILQPKGKDERVHLLFLGFIIDQKGIFDLAEVIKMHEKEWEGKLLLHVGGDHEVERLKNYIKDKNHIIKKELFLSM